MSTASSAAPWLAGRSPRGIIDCYVNANPPEFSPPWDRAEYLFHRSRNSRPQSAAELVESMDVHGISRGLLAPPPEGSGIDPDEGYRWTLRAVQQFPDRFGLSVRVDPWQGMTAVRQLEGMVRNDGAIALRLVPMRIGKPLSHKVYYPLYTKCVELGIPITSTVGIPGPRVPGLMQHPKHLDELCYYWPELKIVTTHGGEPWTKLLVKLMTKWPNLYHMISAFAPKFYPPDTIKFLNSSRGRRKVMFATDYPLISFERALAELPDVPISDESWPYFLAHNAAEVFWNEAAPAAEAASRKETPSVPA